jgi:superoxide dismutase, Fe-Mn family
MQKAVTRGAPFKLPQLPWGEDALAPIVSARTIEFHYGKHHKTYVDTLNKLVADTPYAEMPLEEVVKRTSADKSQRDIFHNAGQAWNHAFFWPSLSPRPGTPSPQLQQLIERDFGGLPKLGQALATAAQTQFGSGWAWVVVRDGKLVVEKTANADTPMASGALCLLTIDVWEHAYYRDYQNRRPDYVKAVLQKLDWAIASDRLDGATR